MIRNLSAPNRVSPGVVILVAFVSLSSSFAGQVEAGDRTNAIRRIISNLVRPIVAENEYPNGLRVHLYDGEFPSGTEIRSGGPPLAEIQTLICEQRCLLFFVDEHPLAHFAHSTQIALWDLGIDGAPPPIQRLQVLRARWWPLVKLPDWEGYPRGGEPYFHTVASRASPAERLRMVGLSERDEKNIIVFELNPARTTNDPSYIGRLTATGGIDGSSIAHPSTSGRILETLPPLIGCGVWAVLIEGSGDTNNSFGVDVERMHNLLTGHRIPEGQIYRFSPFEGVQACHVPQTVDSGVVCPVPNPSSCAPGAEDHLQRTAYCSVGNLFSGILPTEIQRSTAGCSELLVFYSGHGHRSAVDCVSNSSDGHGSWIDVGTLQNWIGAVPCDRATIIVHACESEFLIPILGDHLRQERFVFTSTSDTWGNSYGDIYDENDPNPGDVGSETIGGYIEAFGTGAADISDDSGASDGRITFAEAVAYAIANDVTAEPDDLQKVVSPYPPPDSFVHSCFFSDGQADLQASVNWNNPTSAAETPTTVSVSVLNDLPPLKITIYNTGDAPLAAGTAKLFFSVLNPQSSEQIWQNPARPIRLNSFFPTFQPYWPLDFRQIGNTLLLTGLENGASQDLGVAIESENLFEAGTSVVAVIALDSPQDPIILGPIPISESLRIDDNLAAKIVEVVE